MEINERYAVHNPQDKPVAELPVIWGFNNGGSPQFLHAQLMAEDGTALGSHLCSSEGFMLGDLGILNGTRSDRHETFKEHYPNGYRMDFIPGDEVKEHEGLKKAIELNYAKREQNEEANKGSDAKVEVIMSKDEKEKG